MPRTLQPSVPSDVVGEVGGQAAQLFVAEGVNGGVLRAVFCDELAGGIVYTLGYGGYALAAPGVYGLYVLHELIKVKVTLRQVDEVGTFAAYIGKGGGCGEPAGVAAHYLDDAYHSGVVNAGVPYISMQVVATYLAAEA